MDKPFTCPDCGKTFMLRFVPSRQRCPDCSREHAQIRDRQKNLERYKRKKMGLPPTPVKKTYPGDDELEKNRKIQLVQCRTCEYLYKEGLLEFCDFVSWEGCLRNRGEGPGKCGSYLPKGTLTPEERKTRRMNSLIKAEIDRANRR